MPITVVLPQIQCPRCGGKWVPRPRRKNPFARTVIITRCPKCQTTL